MSTIKRLLAALLVVASIGVVEAKPGSFTSCTTDDKIAVLFVEVQDDAPLQIVGKNIQEAFDKAANTLTAEKLVTKEGYTLFVSGLSERTKKVLEVPEPPQIFPGPCKKK